MKIIFVVLLFTSIAFSKSPEIDIQLHSGNESEKKGKQLIEDFLQRYDLEKYIFTKKIIIQSRIIPHSHPVLILNTRQIDQPERYFSTFIHEQIHWFFYDRKKQTDQFIEGMKILFPNIPNSESGGAKDDISTYLHLGVCYYEFLALSYYLGEEKAKSIFETSDVYSWVNKQVLEKGTIIANALKENGLVL